MNSIEASNLMTSSNDTSLTNSSGYERKTKIVATLGPASESGAVLAQLIEHGLNIARLNFSHGTHADHGTRLKNVREVSKQLNIPVAVMGDLQGPKMRLGIFDDTPVKKGDVIILDTSISEQTGTHIPFPSPVFAAGSQVGDTVFIEDGQNAGRVQKVEGPLFYVEMLTNGMLKNRKGVNAPNLHLRSSILEDKDKTDLRFCLKLGVDYLAISFVRTAEDIREVRKLITEAKAEAPKIIAKIERPEALTNIKEILEEADGIMFARGDLGVETPLTQLPLRQKEVVRLANEMGVFVIVATQMMESMMHNPIPTRAEVSDVANAVLDGADAVMLSGETSKGHYPLEVVRTMSDIVMETEKYLSLKK